MPMETTFTMLKPGVLQRTLAGEIITRIEKKGLQIVAMKMMNLPLELVETHYGEHKGKPFYDYLVKVMTSGPVIAMALKGDNAIAMLRKICGPTSPDQAEPGTIRGDYAMHTPRNLIHASDSPESAARELALFFKPEEILSWEAPYEIWL